MFAVVAAEEIAAVDAVSVAALAAEFEVAASVVVSEVVVFEATAERLSALQDGPGTHLYPQPSLARTMYSLADCRSASGWDFERTA